MSTENGQKSLSPRYDDKPRNDGDCELTGRQNVLEDASQSSVASLSSNKREKETLILSMRDVKGKRKADDVEMSTPLIDNSTIVERNLVQLPVATANDNEREDITPIRTVRVPRNRTLLDSVKAHLAISGESAPQDPVPSLLTRLSDPHVPVNSRKAHHMLSDTQENAADNDHLRHSRKTGRLQSSLSQDSKASSKNSNVSVADVINRKPPISMSAARPIVCQNSVATSTTVEDNTMDVRILSRSMPVPSNSQNQVGNDKLPDQVHDQQTPHMQQSSTIGIDGLKFPNQIRPLAHSTTLNSEESRTRLLARLEIEKQQVVQLSATDNNCSPHPLDDIPSSSSSFMRAPRKSHPIVCDTPLKPHERGPDVLDLASDSLVSEESRKRESKLRARAQLRARLAAEKRFSN